MAKVLAAAAALCAPAAAFAPQGSLRHQPSVADLQGPVDIAAESEALIGTSAPWVGAQAAVGVLGLGAAAALAAGVAVGRRQQRPAARVTCRVAGVCWPLTEKFDPLKLGSTDAKLERYTEVEIKHGRVSMIAVIGYVMPEIFRFPGCEGFGNGLSALSTIPLEGWVQMVAFLGAHEVLVKPRAGGWGKYDFGLGTELLEGIEAGELERRQTVERNNGRLAMVAILGLMVQDGMFGKTPLALIKEGGFWGPSVDVFVKDIPICVGGSMCATRQPPRRVLRTAMRAEAKMSAAVPFLKYPEVLEGWVGGEKGFDPLAVTDALPVYFVREAELKHGRVCMFATIGWIATDLGVHFPGQMFQDVSTIQAHNRMVELGYMQPFLGTIAVLELYAGWLFLEGYEGKIKRDAGDFFFGKAFLPKEEAAANTMRLKELENGRLAMLAFSGICTQAVLSGKSWPFL